MDQDFLHPPANGVGRGDERTHGAHAAGVGHGDREADRAGAGHWRQEDGMFQAVLLAECASAVTRTRSHLYLEIKN
jgi:hypothetical protein